MTLFRLSYWIPPERKAEFAQIYATRIAPVLAANGWVESPQPDRTTVDSVFSKFFAAPSPAVAKQLMSVVWTDSSLNALYRELGTRFGTTSSLSYYWGLSGSASWKNNIRSSLRICREPAGPGKVALRCRQKQLEWDIEGVGPTSLPVHGDEAKLSQVLINLLGNAVKFTETGRVSLRLLPREEDRYRFEVTDTGVGISPEEQTRLFEAFYQGTTGLREGGTGLGLAIAQQLLALMGSRLELESTPGVGSRFFFDLHLPPAHGEIVAHGETTPRIASLAPGHAVDALVVDDVRENREVLAGLLRAIGVQVRLADSGESALQQIRQHPPDIAFLDIRMPGLDGPETAQHIWAEHGHSIKVAAVSASTFDHERRRYLEMGFDAFIDKPFRTGDIHICLSRLLDVEFIYEETSPSADSAVPPDFSDVALPADLLARLRESAELSRVTELEIELEEVARLGSTGKQLADHLRDLSQNFAMEEILAILDTLEEK